MRVLDASLRRHLLRAGGCVYLHALLCSFASAAATGPKPIRGEREPSTLARPAAVAQVAAASTDVALVAPRSGETSLLEPRRDGPYIKYGSGNAAVLISFVGATTYGVKQTCSNPAIAGFAPQICVASLVGALVLDFLAAFLLEGRDTEVFNPHGLHLGMTHGEMRARILESLGTADIGEEGVYIGGRVVPEDGGEVQVFYRELADGTVAHRADYIAAEHRTEALNRRALGRRAEERHRSGTMDYFWRYDNQKRWDHTDKNSDDVKAASKSAAYDWYYNHGSTNRMCGGPVTDSGRLLDDVGIWYAGQPGGASFQFQPGQSASEIGSCAADLGAAGYSTNV